MYRPIKPLGFDKTNPEHALVDLLVEELHTLEGGEIIYWCLKNVKLLDAEKIANNETPYVDELDDVYMEKSSDDGKYLYFEPERLAGKLEINPIIHELGRLGLATIEDADLYVNIAHFHSKMNQAPEGGDIFRITNLIKDENGELKDDYVYYKVSNATPVDLHNYQYINYQIHSEQTNMNDIPAEILNYFVDDEYMKKNL